MRMGSVDLFNDLKDVFWVCVFLYLCVFLYVCVFQVPPEGYRNACQQQSKNAHLH